MKKVILASGSLSRKQQLERLKITFSTVLPNVNEDELKVKIIDHADLSRQLSLCKARNISVQYPDAIIIGGDTITSFNGNIMSKPKTSENAIKQLKMLTGNRHKVITSLAIILGQKEYLHTSVAHMKMRKLNDTQIARYVEIDKPLESCGSCRLDSLGISLFENIECEDYTSIIGIPLIWTAKTLTEMGVSVP